MCDDSCMTKPMQGVKVVELASWTFVPAAGAVLADWGADVIKIEHPKYGDPQRALVIGGIDSSGISFIMEIANRGKRSVGLDVGSEAGRDVLFEMIRQADVFLTNFLPDARQRLKIDVEDIKKVNPRCIYVRGSGHGPKGPDAPKAGYDGTAYWARGGVAHSLTPPEREWPVNQTAAIGDLPGGMTIAGAISAALFHRERTGEATVVDVSLLATAMWSMQPGIVATYLHDMDKMPRQERSENRNPISIHYRTKDGRFFKLSMLESDRWWPDLCRHIERPDLIDDPRFVDAAARTKNSAECVAELDAVFATRTLEEWRAAFDTLAGAWAPVQSVKEIHDDVQAHANGYLREVTHHDGTRYRLVAAPAQFNLEPPDLEPCPEHGQHTELVMLELGYDWDRITELKKAGTIT